MAAERVTIRLNGKPFDTTSETSVAAAILASGESGVRTSVQGEPRAPLCGMGICFECRAIVDGEAHQRTCLILCRDGMEVATRG